MVAGILERIAGLRDERPSAGTRFRLMGLEADITEVVRALQDGVLERVRHEAVLDADADIDFAEASEQVMGMGLEEREEQDETLREQTRRVNEALDGLSEVLAQIDGQLSRRHKDEEYVRLYEAEKRRYLSSGTPRRVRHNFDEWLNNVCYGTPSQDDVNDYVTEKLLHLFEKGVYSAKVEHIQRAKRYPDEFDFDQLDDDYRLKKSVYKHYAALRKMVDYADGFLVVDAARAGQHFYASRHEEQAKAHRSAFLKYMHKIDLAQQERRKLLEMERASINATTPELNYFAPSKNLKVLLTEEWFGMLTTDEKRFNAQWVHGFVDALMASEWRDQLASDWAVKDKRLGLKCMVIGMLKDAGVLRGSYNSIAKLLDMEGEKPATLAKYMGMGKKQPFADWIEAYVKSD